MNEVTVTHKKDVSMWFVIIIGLAFATTQLTWSLFNLAVPAFLQDIFGLELGIVGFVMTWDNIIAFFLQPYIGAKSDTTRTRFGRRMPYIIPGILLSSFFFTLLAIIAETNSDKLGPFKPYHLYLFLGTILIFNLSMAIYRSPAVSLMPDFVPSHKRSLANGIINLMGGLFSAISLFVAGGLIKQGHVIGGFLFVSITMLVCLGILVLFVKEPPLEEETVSEQTKPHESALTQLKDEAIRMLQNPDKSMLYMLLAIFSWFMAWNAIEAFYSLYVWHVYLPDKPREEAVGIAGQILFIFPVVFVLMTLVGGYLGTKIGRILTMKIGLTLFLLGILLGMYAPTLNFYYLVFVIAGIGWGLVNVNSIVVVWEHARDNGTGTGLYYAFSSAAAILGPTLSGFIMGKRVLNTYRALFPFSITFIILAFLLLFKVKKGEVGDRTI